MKTITLAAGIAFASSLSGGHGTAGTPGRTEFGAAPAPGIEMIPASSAAAGPFLRHPGVMLGLVSWPTTSPSALGGRG
ncbi:MAG: hypothetical protein H6686_09975 [Fibrobacteria bacterium]|nr:hypothetical protein [Fibrobacteria bacterium]